MRIFNGCHPRHRTDHHADRTTVVTPVIDVIDKETFNYHGNPSTPMKGVCLKLYLVCT